jgi:hypothetical protein
MNPEKEWLDVFEVLEIGALRTGRSVALLATELIGFLTDGKPEARGEPMRDGIVYRRQQIPPEPFRSGRS